MSLINQQILDRLQQKYELSAPMEGNFTKKKTQRLNDMLILKDDQGNEYEY